MRNLKQPKGYEEEGFTAKFSNFENVQILYNQRPYLTKLAWTQFYHIPYTSDYKEARYKAEDRIHGIEEEPLLQVQ